MPEILKILAHEIKKFAKSNWWIFLIFTLSLILIYKTNSGNIFEISSIFILHFSGDLGVMMMLYYFSIKNNKYGVGFQIFQFIIFTFLGIYAGLNDGKWHYLLPQLVFILPSIKGYFMEFKGKNLSFLNWKLSFCLNLFIIAVNYYLGLFDSIYNIIQISGFFFFSIGLILLSEKQKYIFSLVGIFLITFGSFLAVYESFLLSNIKGIDISYFLLPLTVFVFYIKNFKQFINKN